MKKALSLLFIFFSVIVYSQKQANFWYFGQEAGLDFSSGFPVAIDNGKLNTLEGCSSISDKDGNLLFYSDGTSVWDKNHNLMKYSSGQIANNLLGNPSSSQSALVVPNPKNDNIYYLFTVGAFDQRGSEPGFNFYTIDISKNSGFGEITHGPTDLSEGLGGQWSEKVTAVQSSDCNEIWVISVVNNQFYTYRIDENGVDLTNPIISDTNYSPNDIRGYLKISPDGTKIAIADYNAGSGGNSGGFNFGDSKLYLFEFNTTTGEVSPEGFSLINTISDGAPYGIEFSQQSNKLYTSTHDGINNAVYQFDLLSLNILASKTLIHKQNGYRGALQLAIDGNIYATVPISYPVGTSHLDVIQNPDADPSEVIYTENVIDLGENKSTQGLPPFIQSFFAPVNIVNNISGIVLSNTNQTLCIDEILVLSPETKEAGAIYVWSKDNIQINTDTSIPEITIDNTNFGSGIYELSIDLKGDCKKKLNGQIKIEFVPKPNVIAIPTYVQCDFDSNSIDGFTTFNLASKEAELSNNATNVTVDFFETTDISFNNPLQKNSYTNIVPNNHRLLVRITNNAFPCYQTGFLDLQVNSTGLTSYPNEHLCELDINSNTNIKNSEGSGNSFFDVSEKTQKIINNSSGAYSLSTHTFQYYKTANDASLQTNEILAPYNDDVFINNSDVFIRISNKGVNACENVGMFKIIIEALPIPQGNLNTTFLCVNNPKDNPQQLTIDLNADTGNPTDTYKWYLNNQLITNSNNAIHKANIAGEYKVEAIRKHPQITNSCIGYNTFIVKESNKALILKIKSNDDSDNPSENNISITVEGLGDYEFALNSTNIVDFSKGNDNFSYTFTNINPGLNTIYIRDIQGCGITQSDEVSTIFFQRHFTPNNDGVLDTWKVLGIDNDHFKTVNVQIFDRYGKLIKNIKQKNSRGWDGLFNGKLLPSNDYWFNAELLDSNGKVRKKRGHFSLLRK